MNRRHLLLGAGAAALTGLGANATSILRQPEARVHGLRCAAYTEDLVGRVREGIAAFPAFAARVRGAKVLLKPNLVEVHAGRPVNTEPRMILAALEAFRQLGAAEVAIGEGPGHSRDTDAILWNSGLADLLQAAGTHRGRYARFTDLNVDDWAEVEAPHDFTGLGRLPVSRQVLGADIVVSMPKLKTHHWAGATLSLKNLFGTVPSQVVGWPKNRLHWAGIDNSIVDLWSIIRPAFSIVDGITGMEGDGPIMGTAVDHGVLLFGENLPAVDATAARRMGLRPGRIDSLRMTMGIGGTISALRIEETGDALPTIPYALLPQWARLRA